MDLQGLGRLLLTMAAGLALIGVIFIVGGRMGLGALPGDIRIQREGFGCFFPLASMIIVSLILTVLLNLFLRWFR